MENSVKSHLLVLPLAALLVVIGIAPSVEAAPAVAATQAWSPPAAKYGVATQRDVALRMSDGVVLKANVYRPTTIATGAAAPGRFPVVVTFTPYGKDAGETDEAVIALGMAKDDYLITRGYVHVVVDVRGTGDSQGSWSFEQPRESVDGAEVVAWAGALPYSTGSVGLLGASYGGVSQLLTAGRIGKGSALKAIVPIVPSIDPYRDVFTAGGVPNPLVATVYAGANAPLSAAHALQSGLGSLQTPDDVTALAALTVGHLDGLGVLPVADLLLGGPHANYDEYWTQRAPDTVLPGIVANDVPTMVIGGWRDAFQRGGPLLYSGLQNAAAGRPVTGPMAAGQAASPKYQLIEGPWWHATVAEKGSEPLIDANAIALRWFEQWLKGVDTGVKKTKTPLRSYDLTAGAWTEAASYPYRGAVPTKFYPAASNTLSTTRPTASGTDRVLWSPVPQCTPSISQFILIGNDVQALAGIGAPPPPCDLDDRLTQLPPSSETYTTAPFTAAKVIAGPIAAHVVAKVTTLESEWVVRIEDVAPDGTSLPLARGALLGSHRALDPARTWRTADGSVLLPYHPSTAASLLPTLPGTTQAYDIEVFPVTATIAPGHSLRVTISTGDSPALIPTVGQTVLLAGGVYSIARGGTAPTYIQVPLATPASIGSRCTDALACPE
jgi:putative CocE/NonD family hydrolase